jgi:4-hydroxybenzoate polyprenyltransferase
MRSFVYSTQMVRPHLMLLAAVSTWVIAMLSNGPHYFTTAKVVSPIVMALLVMGASLYHFGAANPMYTRKSEALFLEPVVRKRLILAGLASLGSAIFLTFTYLNSTCQPIVLSSVFIIVAYPTLLSRHWLTKNILIAFVCASPVLLGWFAGHRLHPSVPYGITVTFFAYLAREIVKDIQDRRVNNGYRHTLPLTFGLTAARQITAGVLTLALATLVVFGFKILGSSPLALIPCAIVGWYFWQAIQSLGFQETGTEERESKQILMGSFWLMLTFMTLIFG